MPAGVLVKRIFVVKQTKKKLFKTNTTEWFASQASTLCLAHRLAVKKAKNKTPPLIGWHKLNRISKES